MVRIAPEPLTPVTAAPVMPLVVRLKSARSTPVTDSENITVKSTLAALAGLVSARRLEITLGGISSMSVGVGVTV